MSNGGTSWLGGDNKWSLSAPGEGGAAICLGFQAIASSKRKLKIFSSTWYFSRFATDADLAPDGLVEAPFSAVDESFELLPDGPGWGVLVEGKS